jgi:hypothetical protein
MKYFNVAYSKAASADSKEDLLAVIHRLLTFFPPSGMNAEIAKSKRGFFSYLEFGLRPCSEFRISEAKFQVKTPLGDLALRGANSVW